MIRKVQKWLLFIGICAFLLICGIAILAASKMKSSRVTREKFERIQMGMTMEEVDQIMGMPQHDRLEPENYDWDEFNVLNLPTAIYADDYAMIEISANKEFGVYYKNYGTRRREWLDYLNGIFGR